MIEKKEFSLAISAKNNFDFLRLLFALSILFNHFGELINNPIYWPISSPMAVSGFFIISGFLITKSYYRSASLKEYYIKRIKRIVPAYVIIVIACAIGLSIFSNLPFSIYFTSNSFFKYLLANLGFLNFIQPTLPGVFTSNPDASVNGALWTIKVEIALYLCVPVFAELIRRIKPKWIVFVTIYLVSFGFILLMNHLYDKNGNVIYSILDRQFLGQLTYFVSGMLLLFYFDFFQRNIKWFLSLAILVLIIKLGFDNNNVIKFLFPISFCIIIISIAYHFKPLNNVAKYGDISYGVYLFHYPIIQIFYSVGLFKQYLWAGFVLCLLTVIICAFFSWHLLEKRILNRQFSFK